MMDGYQRLANAIILSSTTRRTISQRNGIA